MTDASKTIIAVLAAAGLAAAAWLTRPAAVTSEHFSDVGEVFYPTFTDPIAARSFEVVAFDEPTAAYKPFKVEFDGKRWLIPSHHNYPADAQQRMGEAASAFIGLKKDQVVTDRAAEHQSLGVLAPDDDAAPLSGRGTRVTIKDDQGRILSDIILGKNVGPEAGDAGAAADRRYVRVPDQTRVYACSLDKTFSTRFGDWVETDLLRLTSGDAGTVTVDRVEIDRYTVEEKSGRQQAGQTLTVSRAPAPDSPQTPQPGSPPAMWTIEANPGGPPGATEEVNTARIDEMISALRDLRIVGVRPKPANLAKVLSGQSENKSISMGDQMSLQSRGFYVTDKGQLLANDGQMSAYSSDGVVYTLWFGEVLFGEGEEISAGVEPAAESAADAPPAEDAQTPKGKESRYLFITVLFDETLIPAPTPPAPEQSAEPGASPSGEGSEGAPEAKPEAAEDAGSASAEKPAPAVDEKEMAEYQARVAARNGRLESGRKRADALSRRFADWYYVIDAAAFNKLRPVRDEVVKAAAPKPLGPAPLPQSPPIGPASGPPSSTGLAPTPAPAPVSPPSQPASPPPVGPPSGPPASPPNADKPGG